jgi:hypothetical protein
MKSKETCEVTEDRMLGQVLEIEGRELEESARNEKRKFVGLWACVRNTGYIY